MQVTQQHPTGEPADLTLEQVRDAVERGINALKACAEDGTILNTEIGHPRSAIHHDGYSKACADILRSVIEPAFTGRPVPMRRGPLPTISDYTGVTAFIMEGAEKSVFRRITIAEALEDIVPGDAVIFRRDGSEERIAQRDCVWFAQPAHEPAQATTADEKLNESALTEMRADVGVVNNVEDRPSARLKNIYGIFASHFVKHFRAKAG